MKKIGFFFSVVTLGYVSLAQAVTVSWTTDAHIGTESGWTRLYTAKLSAPISEDVIVPFRVSGTATETEDYIMDTAPLVIKAGFTSATGTITIVNDQIEEPHEYVTLYMGAVSNLDVQLGAITTYRAVILNDDNRQNNK